MLEVDSGYWTWDIGDGTVLLVCIRQGYQKILDLERLRHLISRLDDLSADALPCDQDRILYPGSS